MKDTDKVTLTFGQLKELIQEARCKGRKCKDRKILKEYEIDDNGYDDEGNYVGMDAKYDWERRHGGIYSDPDEELTPYQRRKRGKYRSDWGDLPGYGDPETWGGREPH